MIYVKYWEISKLLPWTSFMCLSRSLLLVVTSWPPDSLLVVKLLVCWHGILRSDTFLNSSRWRHDMAQGRKPSRAPGGSRGYRPYRRRSRDDRHLEISVDNSGLFNILVFMMPYRDDLSPNVRKVICVTFMLFSDSLNFGFTWYYVS